MGWNEGWSVGGGRNPNPPASGSDSVGRGSGPAETIRPLLPTANAKAATMASTNTTAPRDMTRSRVLRNSGTRGPAFRRLPAAMRSPRDGRGGLGMAPAAASRRAAIRSPTDGRAGRDARACVRNERRALCRSRSPGRGGRTPSTSERAARRARHAAKAPSRSGRGTREAERMARRSRHLDHDEPGRRRRPGPPSRMSRRTSRRARHRSNGLGRLRGRRLRICITRARGPGAPRPRGGSAPGSTRPGRPPPRPSGACPPCTPRRWSDTTSPRPRTRAPRSPAGPAAAS